MPGEETGRTSPVEFRIILLIGAPGSGKGTQSALLESRFGLTSVSTGAILREEAKRETPEGYRLRETMASGALVDDATVCDAVVSQIKALRRRSDGPLAARATAGLILDGFPRTVRQARYLDHLLDDLGLPRPLVLHLDVPADVLSRRLARRRQCAKCGAVYNLAGDASIRAGRCRIDGGALVERDDDNDGVVARRLAAYETATLPVVDYYRKGNDRTGTYRRIDGDRSAHEIADEICDVVLFAETAVAA